jgi:hypothetical protein
MRLSGLVQRGVGDLCVRWHSAATACRCLPACLPACLRTCYFVRVKIMGLIIIRTG